MRFIVLFWTVSLTLSSVGFADQIDGETRRCAFIGPCGSFTVVGSTGTAAYKLGDNRYIADLAPVGDEPNWWIYRPASNGDPSTLLWAFARRREHGKYSVMRY